MTEGAMARPTDTPSPWSPGRSPGFPRWGSPITPTTSTFSPHQRGPRIMLVRRLEIHAGEGRSRGGKGCAGIGEVRQHRQAQLLLLALELNQKVRFNQIPITAQRRPSPALWADTWTSPWSTRRSNFPDQRRPAEAPRRGLRRPHGRASRCSTMTEQGYPIVTEPEGLALPRGTPDA